MKRVLSLVLSMILVLSFGTPALAAEPTPPDWVKAEEYCTFADGDAYQAETWQEILRLRADAAAREPGAQAESGFL